MRKDTRIGVAIGLVLFAVLIVYAVVAPKSTKKKVTLDKTGKAVAPVDDPSAHTPTGDTAVSPGGEAVVDASAEASHAATDSEPSDPKRTQQWLSVLSATGTWDNPVVTRTPPMNTPEAGGTSHPMTEDHPATHVVTPSNLDGSSSRDTNLDPLRRDAKPIAGGATTHRVQQGETFVSIARAYYHDGRNATEIQKANPNIDPRRLRPGTEIQLPDLSRLKSDSTAAAATASARIPKATNKVAAVSSPSEYPVESNDNLYKISVKIYGKGDRVNAIYQLNRQLIGPDSGRLHPGMILKLPAMSDRITTASAAR